MRGRPSKTAEEFEIAKRLGANIREARLLLGLSGEELGEAVGRSKQAVSEWEKNGNGPEGFLIPKIAETLGVTPSWLFHGVLKMPDRHGPEVISRKLVKRLGMKRAAALLSLDYDDLVRCLDAMIESSRPDAPSSDEALKK